MFYSRINVRCAADLTDILTAELAEAGFDAFIETSEGFEGFAEGMAYDAEMVDDIWHRYAEQQPSLSFEFDRIEKQNWNEEWEKSYEPVIVDGKCIIRAEFHQPTETYPYEIIITPKMSFGTGHHQTTHLMIEAQLEHDHEGKRVMDAGCGTSVLSIMASKRGAAEVHAFDIDDWSVLNGKENVEINRCKNISIRKGTLDEQGFRESFDIILANINKNVLLAQIGPLGGYLTAAGLMLISGFYEQDAAEILRQAEKFNLSLLKAYSRDNWAALLLGI